ncbi:putative transcription factor bHLH family [Medicago truncatula]|uniref:Putative transcription factor bHLH family n=1 Tax=Medicago truncatula TaxID=3880 RepID=A0A396JNS6_MEDTR|nr:transcription factor ORG2 isoform X3 [Medicago truncatula]RHN78864.1 putative transcription factor bHLH family [Medicago truncatula]
MLAISPPMFSTIGWPFEEPLSHNQHQNSFYKDTVDQLFNFHDQVEAEINSTDPSQSTSSDLSMVKKLVHNASERDRRKKINNLYSSLRSLLPVSDQMKKLSIPGTISRVLKYIPELQNQVEGLIKRKDEILLGLSPQVEEFILSKESQRKKHSYNSGFVVSSSRLNDSEITIQISCYTVQKIPLSEILICLENDGLLLLNVSSSKTFGGRVFYNLHFQVDKTQILESHILNEKLLSIMEKEGEFLKQ